MKFEMNEYIDYGITGVVWLLVIVYIVHQAHFKKWLNLIILVVVFTVLHFQSERVGINLQQCLLITLLITFIVGYIPRLQENCDTCGIYNGSGSRESFDNPPSADIEGQQSSAPNVEDNANNDNEKELETEIDTENFGVNIGKTFLEAYSSLDPSALKEMTKDAKDLISTQKSLVETIKTLAPVVMEGRKMLENFKDYFGATPKK